ncbi:MAG: hypothetical protein KDA61_20780, partial [Planctomycetales bacterium]|nr:hypothetical protein [Planctomycetales bacterium]
MSNGTQTRTRQQRVAAVELPPGVWKSIWSNLQKGRVLLRLALCAATALFLWGFNRSWDPPFAYNLGDIPERDLMARVGFSQPDPEATSEARQRARRFAVGVYDQNPEALVQLRAQLRSEIGKLAAAETFDDVDGALWASFQPSTAPGTPDPTTEQQVEQFNRL